MKAEYLEEKYPQLPLMPKDLYQRAQVRIWIDFCNTRVHAAAADIRYQREPEKARERLLEHFKTLDQEMTGRDYIVGDYSLADITYVPFFTRMERYDIPVDHLPNFRAWRDRLLSRPTISSTP